MRRTIQRVLAIAAASSIAIAAAQAAEAQTAEEYIFEIERTPLRAALTEFSLQTGLYVSYLTTDSGDDDELVGPLKGRHTVESALDQLVAGTALTYTRANRSTISVVARDLPRITLAKLDVQTEVAPAVGRRRATTEAVTLDGYDRGNLEEVIVTAQRRAESLQDVPISISVVGGGALDQSTAEGLSESLYKVPGVTYTTALQGGGTQLTVRGVTAASPLFAGGNPIGYYLDAIPFGMVKSAVAPDANAYDMERLEVLRGPQGTLYGTSALNGVVRVLTKDANPEKFEFKARTSGSTTRDGGGNYRGDAAINIPLIEGKLATRAVVGYQSLSGWLDKPNKKDFNDGEIRNFRLKVNAQPTDEFSVGVSGWASRADHGGPSQGDDKRRNSFLLNEPVQTDFDAYNLKLAYDFGAFTVNSYTSQLDYHTSNDLDLFGSILFTGLDSDVLTEEVIVSSNSSGVWNWSIGSIYRDAEDRTFQYFTTGEPGAPRTDLYEWLDHSKSYAFFGEATRSFNDGKFAVTAGLRYFDDDLKSQEGAPGEEPALRAHPKFDSVTPRVVLTWHPGDRATLYASYGEGFRSGFDQFLLAKTVLNLPPVQPDTLTNYEVGVKGDTDSAVFSYEAAVYYIDWQDVQQALSIDVDGIPRQANLNGRSASGVGVDLGATIRPSESFNVSTSLSWNDLSFDSDVFSAGILLFPRGDRLANSPEYTASLSTEYTTTLGASGYRGRFEVSANYVSEQNFVDIVDNARYLSIGDEMLTGHVALAIESPARWTASFFVDNVTDEDGTPLAALFGVTDWSMRVRPRTMGLQLEYSF